MATVQSRPNAFKMFVDDVEAIVTVRDLLKTFPRTPERIAEALGSYLPAEHDRVLRAVLTVLAELQVRILDAGDLREEIEHALNSFGGELNHLRDSAADLFALLDPTT